MKMVRLKMTLLTLCCLAVNFEYIGGALLRMEGMSGSQEQSPPQNSPKSPPAIAQPNPEPWPQDGVNDFSDCDEKRLVYLYGRGDSWIRMTVEDGKKIKCASLTSVAKRCKCKKWVTWRYTSTFIEVKKPCGGWFRLCVKDTGGNGGNNNGGNPGQGGTQGGTPNEKCYASQHGHKRALRDCKGYEVCVGNTWILIKCQADLLFDINKDRCVNKRGNLCKEGVINPDITDGTDDPQSEPVTMPVTQPTSSVTTTEDDTEPITDSSTQSTEVTTDDDQEKCYTNQHGHKRAVRDCEGYEVCVGNTWILIKCQADLLFDINEDRCVNKRGNLCKEGVIIPDITDGTDDPQSEPVTTPVTQPTSSVTTTEDDTEPITDSSTQSPEVTTDDDQEKCYASQHGHKRALRDCKGYEVCVGNTWILIKCQADLIFDINKDLCVNKRGNLCKEGVIIPDITDGTDDPQSEPVTTPVTQPASSVTTTEDDIEPITDSSTQSTSPEATTVDDQDKCYTSQHGQKRALKDCKGYEACVGNIWIPTECQPGLLFDINEDRCVNKRGNLCKDGVIFPDESDGTDNDSLPDEEDIDEEDDEDDDEEREVEDEEEEDDEEEKEEEEDKGGEGKEEEEEEEEEEENEEEEEEETRGDETSVEPITQPTQSVTTTEEVPPTPVTEPEPSEEPTFPTSEPEDNSISCKDKRKCDRCVIKSCRSRRGGQKTCVNIVDQMKGEVIKSVHLMKTLRGCLTCKQNWFFDYKSITVKDGCKAKFSVCIKNCRMVKELCSGSTFSVGPNKKLIAVERLNTDGRNAECEGKWSFDESTITIHIPRCRGIFKLCKIKKE